MTDLKFPIKPMRPPLVPSHHRPSAVYVSACGRWAVRRELCLMLGRRPSDGMIFVGLEFDSAWAIWAINPRGRGRSELSHYQMTLKGARKITGPLKRVRARPA